MDRGSGHYLHDTAYAQYGLKQESSIAQHHYRFSGIKVQKNFILFSGFRFQSKEWRYKPATPEICRITWIPLIRFCYHYE